MKGCVVTVLDKLTESIIRVKMKGNLVVTFIAMDHDAMEKSCALILDCWFQSIHIYKACSISKFL